MSSTLTPDKPTAEPPTNLIIRLCECGFLDVFACSVQRLTTWLAKILSLFKDNGQNNSECLDKIKFCLQVLDSKRWESWFTKEERAVIVAIAFLNGIGRVWKAKVDRWLVEACVNCRPESCPYLAAIFGHGVGLADDLNDVTKRLLIAAVDDFVPSPDVATVSVRLRCTALQGFKQGPETKMCIARGALALGVIATIAYDPENLGGGDFKQRIFMIERVYMPMLSLISQRNDAMMPLINNIRTALKTMHGPPKTQ
jgi:hypothetical protein